MNALEIKIRKVPVVAKTIEYHKENRLDRR